MLILKDMRQIKVGLTMTVTLGRVFMAGTEPPAQHALCQMLSQKTLNLGQSICIFIDLGVFQGLLEGLYLFQIIISDRFADNL